MGCGRGARRAVAFSCGVSPLTLGKNMGLRVASAKLVLLARRAAGLVEGCDFKNAVGNCGVNA